MAKKHRKQAKHTKPQTEPEPKITFWQFLTAPQSLPGLLLIAGGIFISVIPTFLAAAQTLSMILGLVGVVVSMSGLKYLTERMPKDR